MKPISVGLAGVTGYTGMELLRLLPGHANLRLVRATSRSEAGKSLRELFPFLQGFELGELTATTPDPDDLAASCELVFLALPHGAAMAMAGALRDKGTKVVDLSADFRLHDRTTYTRWYGLEHTRPELLPEAVYGLPELYREQISKASLVANPGCYPTSALLGLYPALKQGLVETEGMVIDAKSGTTGAGRTATTGTLFCEVSDTFRAYNLGRHRHTPEIEQELTAMAGEEITVSFNTHLLPINRGILSTIYTRLKSAITTEDAVALYAESYRAHPWVRIVPAGQLPETRHLRGTIFCDIGLVADPRTNRLIIVSAMDNLCRGASGQALANANLMLGLEMDQGLCATPLVP